MRFFRSMRVLSKWHLTIRFCLFGHRDSYLLFRRSSQLQYGYLGRPCIWWTLPEEIWKFSLLFIRLAKYLCFFVLANTLFVTSQEMPTCLWHDWESLAIHPIPIWIAHSLAFFFARGIHLCWSQTIYSMSCWVRMVQLHVRSTLIMMGVIACLLGIKSSPILKWIQILFRVKTRQDYKRIKLWNKWLWSTAS